MIVVDENMSRKMELMVGEMELMVGGIVCGIVGGMELMVGDIVDGMELMGCDGMVIDNSVMVPMMKEHPYSLTVYKRHIHYYIYLDVTLFY